MAIFDVLSNAYFEGYQKQVNFSQDMVRAEGDTAQYTTIAMNMSLNNTFLDNLKEAMGNVRKVDSSVQQMIK